MSAPSTNRENGQRDTKGRFATGNKGGPGNPLAGRVAKLRSSLLAAVTIADIRAAIRALVAKARGGDVAACRELFDRTIGKPVELDLLERLEAIESKLREAEG